MTDGLADLAARRTRRVRSAPPPRHPKSPDTEDTASDSINIPETPTSPPEATPVVRKAPGLVKRQTVVEPLRAIMTPPAPLRAVQTYMTEAEIDLLRSARAAALMRRGDVTNSAVVRLALRELFDRLGPDGVVDMVMASDEGLGRQGRPRR